MILSGSEVFIMFHKDEAQRVIAISLGKIASYRNQRGGSSLHKNLLVANVLNKVRTFVNEDQASAAEQPIDKICSPEPSHLLVLNDYSKMPNNTQENFRPNEECQVMFSKSGHFGAPDVVIGSFETRDAVNGCDYSSVPVTDYGAECEISSTSSRVSYTQLKSDGESRVTYETNNDCYREVVPESRGLKRRQNMYEKDTVYAKRRKCDNEFPFFSDTSWRLQPAISDADSESESDLEVDQESSASSQDDNNMDTEQICSLVSVFKCSFHGLGLLDNSEVGSSEEVTSTDYGYSNSHLFVQELTSTSNRVGKPNALRRGLSLPDLCAKQADLRCQPFQLTAPVVALTV